MTIASAETKHWTSSLIKYTQYVQEEQKLFVNFNNEAQYLYYEITIDEYENFCKAESQGAYFGKNLRGKRSYSKVNGEEIGEIITTKKEEEVENGNQESI